MLLVRVALAAALAAPTVSLAAQGAAAEFVTTSEYVTMRDGTRLAVDVHLPSTRQRDQRLPALFEITRYWRASEDPTTGARRRSLGDLDLEFLRNGYAVVKVDARGSGASFGVRAGEYAPQEVKDGWDLVDWVTRQPWSSGSVGAYGTSYSGTTAELLAAAGHPAVKAVVPGWSDWDIYTSPVRPYGIATTFINEWGGFVAALDRNDRAVMRGAVRRVDADSSGALVAAAVRDHERNLDVAAWAQRAEYRDDRSVSGVSYADIGPMRWRAEIRRSNVPMLVFASWFDAATAEAALDRFRSFGNPQKLVIMASAHGGITHASPFSVSDAPVAPTPTQGEVAKMRVQFFDRYLKGTQNGVEGWPAIRYYTLGTEEYRESSRWPVEETTMRRFYPAAAGVLTTSASKAIGADRYVVDFGVNTGPNNRWATQMGRPVLKLNDRGAMDARMLTYTTPPLTEDLHIVGSPTIDLTVSSTQADGALLVYLEDIDPSGQSRYLTEGGLRLVHRKVSRDTAFGVVPYHSFARVDAVPMRPGQRERVRIRILPTAVVVKAGHRLRLAIAGADSTALERVPATGTPTLTVHRGGSAPSVLELPVVPRR
jgi:putative CocE/NonD family hydrolase